VTEILIDESHKLIGKIFRVAEFGRRACKKCLWCRVDWHNDDWRLTFFDSFRGADHDWKPLQSLNKSQIWLAAKAIEHVQQWLTEGNDTDVQEGGGS